VVYAIKYRYQTRYNTDGRCVVMADPRSFLDNLANLHLVMSVALEHLQGNRDEFAATSAREHVTQAQTLVGRIRNLAAELEKEFQALESLVAEQGRLM
jgi:hypothetical protein